MIGHRDETQFPTDFGPATKAKGRAFTILGRRRPEKPQAREPGYTRKDLARRRKANQVAKRQRAINRSAA